MQATTSEKGILRPLDAAAHIELRRYPAAADVGRYVERYWAVHWDLRGRAAYDVELIPHPSINLGFTREAGAQVHGVGTRKSIHPLAGAGWVFGVKFRPGGFAAYTGAVAAALTDRAVPLTDVFGPSAGVLADRALDGDSDEHRVSLVEAFLRERIPGPDADFDRVVRAVAVMLDDRSVTRVEQAAERVGLPVRALQRLFRRYVGVGPKWVIRRYRMHDAAERLAADPTVDPAALAVELGWFDQSHFNREFAALIGQSPRAYAAACHRAGDREPMVVANEPRARRLGHPPR